MKKIFLIALAFAAFSGVKAQNEGFSIAPKIGMNVSKVSDMSFSDVKAKSLADFNIGLTGQYRFENSFALETGIIYSRQGVKLKEEGEKLNIKLGYINVPVLAKYYIVKGLNVFAGPELGFCVSKKSNFDEIEEGLKDAIKGFSLAASVGAGYEFDCGLLLQMNYNIGLTKINKDGDEKNRNNVFQVSAGWRFL